MSERSHVIHLSHPVNQVIARSGFEVDGHGERACANARQEGYRKGLEEAARNAREGVEDDHRRWSREIRSVIESLGAQEENLATQMRPAILDLVLKGVRRIVEAYEPDREAVERIVSATIDKYPREEPNLTVRLHPDDCRLVEDLTERWTSRVPGFQLRSDPSLHRGDCMANGRFGVTDARLDTKLDNLRNSLA